MRSLIHTSSVICLLLAAFCASAQTATFNNTLKAANNGNNAAKYNLGVYYMNGMEGVAKNYETAIRWFKEAAAAGDANAMMNLGYCYIEIEEYDMAIQWYNKAIKKYSDKEHLAKCHYGLAESYFHKEMYDTAIQWLNKIVKSQDKGLQQQTYFRLGTCYFQKKEYKTSLEWFQKAKSSDNIETSLINFNIGACLWNLEEYDKAMPLMENNIGKIDSDDDTLICGTYYQMARAYYYGNYSYPGIDKNESKGIAYFKNAANGGHGEAALKLAYISYYTDDDIDKALGWIEVAKRSKYYLPTEEDIEKLEDMILWDIEEMIDDGLEYLESEEYQDAIDRVKYLADKGDAYAQYITGIALYYMDAPGAETWLEKAASQGIVGAMEALAIIYADKKQPDFTNAKKWYDKAKAAGSTDQEFVEEILNSPEAKAYFAKLERDRKKYARQYRMSVFNDPEDPERCAMLTFGYVNKIWEMTDGEGSGNTGYFSNGPIHGLQIGLRYNPKFSHGFGLHTGLYYEYYAESERDQTIDDEWGYPVDCDIRFEQHEIYIPAHLEFRANFSEDFNMFINAGVGFNYCFYARELYHNMEDYENYSYDSIFDDSTLIKPFNITSEIGLGVQFSNIQIQATFAKGLLNMSTEDGVYVYQKKPLTISLGFIF